MKITDFKKDIYLTKDEFCGKKLSKVIFLDIDGVLNSECTRGYFQDIEREYFENLVYIVRKTDAKIVLTSSWRYLILTDYSDIDNELYNHFSDNVKLLSSYLNEYNIEIYDMVPITLTSDNTSRPYEIRKWLVNNNVEKFIILDDDIFYDWGFLKDYCVFTRYYEDNKIVKGLTKELAEETVNKLQEG